MAALPAQPVSSDEGDTCPPIARKEIAMHTMLYAALMLHNVPPRELQDALALIPPARRVHGSQCWLIRDTTLVHRLHVALNCASERLRGGGIRRTNPLLGTEAG
jgi:hypothetical protein